MESRHGSIEPPCPARDHSALDCRGAARLCNPLACVRRRRSAAAALCAERGGIGDGEDRKPGAQGRSTLLLNLATPKDPPSKIGQNELTKTEIRSALAVGKEVIVHTDPISVPGWSGAGYVIFDPDTGAGAWKIGGGLNGGTLQLNDAAHAISWLFSLLDKVGQSAWLKSVGAFFSSLLDVVVAAIDTAKCGLAYAVAKLVAASFVAVGATFFVLPIVFLFVKVVATALVISSIIGSIAATAFSRAWSCE